MSSFQGRGTKLDRFLDKNQYPQRKLLYFVNWHIYWRVVEKCQNLYFKVNFLFQNSAEFFWYQFRGTILVKVFFLISSIFETLYFLIYLSTNFVSLPWKLDNPHCHNIHTCIHHIFRSKSPRFAYQYPWVHIQRCFASFRPSYTS